MKVYLVQEYSVFKDGTGDCYDLCHTAAVFSTKAKAMADAKARHEAWCKRGAENYFEVMEGEVDNKDDMHNIKFLKRFFKRKPGEIWAGDTFKSQKACIKAIEKATGKKLKKAA